MAILLAFSVNRILGNYKQQSSRRLGQVRPASRPERLLIAFFCSDSEEEGENV